MLDNILISVIVPVYNSERTVVDCLNSICNSSYKNLEIIVVYKKGKDKTLEKIKTIFDGRIKIVEQKENSGIGGARNIGIDNANGEWIGFVEADDVIASDLYEKLLSAALKGDCSITQGEIFACGKQWTFCENRLLKTFIEKYSSIKSGACFDKLFRRSFIEKYSIRFPEKVKYEDNLFVFKAFYYSNVATVKGAFYYYNFSPRSAEYLQELKTYVLPVTSAILSFFKDKRLSWRKSLLIKKKIVESFAIIGIMDDKVYKSLKLVMGKPLFLTILRFKKMLKLYSRTFKKKLCFKK